MDLVVNFPIGYITTNWEKELPRLDQFMNGQGYKDKSRSAMRRETPGELPARVLLDSYAHQLRRIGYEYIRDHVAHAYPVCLEYEPGPYRRGSVGWSDPFITVSPRLTAPRNARIIILFIPHILFIPVKRLTTPESGYA